MGFGSKRGICFFFSSLLLGSCGSESSSAPAAAEEAPKFYLDREFTNQTTNTLLLNFQEEDGYTFKIGGEAFTADISLDSKLSMTDSVKLSYPLEAEYALDLAIYLSDGTVFVEDTLTWEYSLEIPDAPIVAFSEEATNDDNVVILVSASRSPKTTEIWVEGDLNASYGATGVWLPIPTTGQVPLTISSADGLKNFTIKLRNIFGNESATAEMSILRKSAGPSNCTSHVSTTSTANGTLRVKIEGENDGPLFYNILGDLAEVGTYTEFSDSVITPAQLSSGLGTKVITIYVRDLAQNFCEPMQHTIEMVASHASEEVIVNAGALWTDDRSITLTLNYDYLPGDNPEMYISGNIAENASTDAWVPYQEELAVTLTPTNGNRFIRAKFRRGEVASNTVETAIFLVPYILIQGSGATRTLRLSEIIGMTSMTITGCEESFTNIAFADPLSCTVAGDSAQATYYLSDGTAVSRSEDF